MPLKELISRRVAEAGGRLRVRSALNPVLWLCLFVTLPCLYAASRYESTPPLWLVVLMFTPVALVTVGFLFLLLFDRDKLQSEEYQIRKRSLELIQQKGDAFPVAPTSIEIIANPERPMLADKSERP